ncbi:MAG TPA: DUF190 domain-containing protein [Stenotrophobium sp.]|jgi:PII-like signaling protein|nr:DUF190 domain-containing protein [Stenotrophobium sp.]
MDAPNQGRTNTKGVALRFLVHENRKCHGLLAYEWLLETAKKLEVPGGTVYRSMAGFGRHGVLHEQHFFELAGDLALQVVFILSDAEAERLLDLVAREENSFFYLRSPVEYGVIGGKA